jgi:integrase
MRLSDVRTTEVESWLRHLPLARSSCAKIRNLLSVLFNHACRHELFDRNPIRLVRQGAKRRSTPSVLTPVEIKALLGGLRLRERTLVLLAVSTGLRQSELFALKWGDIDYTQLTMNVARSIVYGVVGPCKTEASQKPVPVHQTALEALSKWREVCRYNKSDDWVFASRRHRGRKPIWGQAILRRYLRPAAQRVGIQKQFGWHTFRHTYSTLLRSVGTGFDTHNISGNPIDRSTEIAKPPVHDHEVSLGHDRPRLVLQRWRDALDEIEQALTTRLDMSAVLNVVWRPEPFCSACRCYRHCHGKRRR